MRETSTSIQELSPASHKMSLPRLSTSLCVLTMFMIRTPLLLIIRLPRVECARDWKKLENGERACWQAPLGYNMPGKDKLQDACHCPQQLLEKSGREKKERGERNLYKERRNGDFFLILKTFIDNK